MGFEPTQLSLVELESIPLDHSGKLSVETSSVAAITSHTPSLYRESRLQLVHRSYYLPCLCVWLIAAFWARIITGSVLKKNMRTDERFQKNKTVEKQMCTSKNFNTIRYDARSRI